MAKEVKEEKIQEETPEESKKVKKDLKDNKIKKLEEELADYKDKFYRAIADLDNQRKQYEKEYHTLVKYAGQNLAESLLPSIEMFSLVVNNTDNLPSEVVPYAKGFEMIYRQMNMALEANGVKEIECKVGDSFDHNVHQAMETEEVTDKEKVDKIVKIISKGYMIYDRLLKPVTVIVGKLKEDKKDDKVEENSTDNKENA